MKKSFLIVEILALLIIFSIIYTTLFKINSREKVDLFVQKIEIYLNFLRYKAFTDNKTEDSEFWHKKRWIIKFLRCRESEGGGVYMSIFNDDNEKSHANNEEALKDPLTNRLITNSNYCKDDLKYSPFSLLKNYNIEKVELSCNSTTSLGEIAFSEDGRVYSKLSPLEEDFYSYEIKKPCSMKFISNNGYFRELVVYPKTGFIELVDRY